MTVALTVFNIYLMYSCYLMQPQQKQLLALTAFQYTVAQTLVSIGQSAIFEIFC